MIAGFVVAPLLVRRLGTTGYGLWIVIGSLRGYFGLLDLGLRGSVGRQLAFHRARSDHEATNRTLSSAFAILGSLGILIVLATLIAAGLFDRIFQPPVDLIDDARLALLIVGLNLAITFPLQVFDGNLWAAQRFDILNLVDIPMTIARVALTFAVVRDASDIVLLATLTLLITAGSGAIKAAVSFRQDPSLRIRPRFVSRDTSRGLFGYGWWSFVLTMARLTKTQLSPILIGAQLGIPFVTPYSIARRLQDYAHRVLWTATGVAVPIATGFHARAEISQQQNLFIEGGKYATVAAIYFVAFFACLGRTLIGLWMGPAFMSASILLLVLSLGEFVQMTQSLTGSIILATARHKVVALVAVLETAISVILVAIVVQPYGLFGVCLALAVPQVLFSGIGTMIYGCKVTKVSVTEYLKKAVLPAVTAGAVPVALLGIITRWSMPSGWGPFLLYSAVYSLVYFAACVIVLRPPLGVAALTDLKTALFRS